LSHNDSHSLDIAVLNHLQILGFVEAHPFFGVRFHKLFSIAIDRSQAENSNILLISILILSMCIFPNRGCKFLAIGTHWNS